jgi:salicylate hydroxylase
MLNLKPGFLETQRHTYTNNMAEKLQFIISGGGIGGLAAAMVLAQDGHHVNVLEQAPAFGEIDAGIQLGPNIFRMFHYLGLTEAVSQMAFFPPQLGMNDVRTGEKVVKVPLGDNARASYGSPYGVIYRADLHQVFVDACKAQPNVTFRVNARVESFEQSADGVKARLADGEVIEGSALIGADGMWSKIREIVVGDGKPRVSGHIAYRAVLEKRYRHICGATTCCSGVVKKPIWCITHCAGVSFLTW